MNIYQKLLTLAAVATASGVLFSASVYGDDDDDRKGGFGWFSSSRLDVAPVKNPKYQEECGGCHFAYQPGLLPEKSWRKMMAGLDDHFGDNAELDAETHKAMLGYLVANSADKSNYKRSRRIVGSLRQGEVPLRISDTVYFKRKHNEIPMRYLIDNEAVGSYSNCGACHTHADEGSYDEDEVTIPGVGRWED
ncbi:MAG: diheme cytochrome c [Gammaproteobacteria bacterium]|nr:diheme cytochrome c [Gammaproteobacteria bacterium]MCW8922806.1 diheme cytochrome c [Gammaproteobacteria bacterium]